MARTRSSWPSSAVTPTICPGWTFAPTATARSASRERSVSFIRAAYASRERLCREIPADRGDQGGRRHGGRNLARLALAAGQIEVPVEIARLPDDARSPQDQSVGLEQRADVDVGQQTSVRGVAGALEPVELEALQRVRRGDLVDDQHPAAEARHPGELGDGELGPRDVVQRPVAGGEI